MIAVDAATAQILRGSYKLSVRAESWLAGQLLADSIPITAGSEEGIGTAQVPHRVTLTVPRRDRGIDYAPGPGGPLAADGQRLRIEIGISAAQGQTTWIQRGWFVVTDSQLQGDTVAVEAANLLWLIHEAELVNPYQPTTTFLPTLRTLLEPAITVRDGGVGDRAVPAGVNFDQSRIGAVYELLDAWPARGSVSADGDFLLLPPVSTPASARSYTDGTGGTVIRFNSSSTRTDAFNMVVAAGQDASGNQVQGIAYRTDGPRAYGGPFNPLPVPARFFSPLLTTPDQCRAAANTVLARRVRESAAEFTAEIVPDPTLQLGDVVDITTDRYTALLCSVEGYSMPYRPGAASMTVTLRAVA